MRLDDEALQANEDARRKLVELLRSYECVALVGAGCSIPAGLPSWDVFLDELEEMAIDLPVPFVPDAEARRAAPLRYAGQIAAHCSDNGLREKYLQWLQRVFGVDVDPPHLTRRLVSLPFRALLTTNYDGVLEEGLADERITYDSIDVQRDTPFTLSKKLQAIAVSDGRLGVFHLHGHHRAPNSMVVNDMDYDRAYGTDGSGATATVAPAAFVLTSLLGTRPVVFLGFSFHDPYLTEVLDRVTREGWSWGAGFHYAVMPFISDRDGGSLAEAKRLRDEFGVETVFYQADDGDHSGFESVVEQLASELGVSPRSEAPVGASPSTTTDAGSVWIRRLTQRAAERAQVAADAPPPSESASGATDAD